MTIMAASRKRALQNSGEKLPKRKRKPGGRPFPKGGNEISAMGKQWKPGESGNPGGRPSDKDFRHDMRIRAVRAAQAVAKQIGDRQLPTADVKAFEAFAHYGGLEPPKKVEHSGPDGGPIEHVDLDLDQLTTDELEGLDRYLEKAKRKAR